MGTTSLYENKSIVKESLVAQMKAYRNLSTKLALAMWCAALAGHFALAVSGADPANLNLEDAILQSFQFSLVFALVGYCIGAVLGSQLQRKRIKQILDEKARRRRYIEEQVAIRKAKLDSLD